MPRRLRRRIRRRPRRRFRKRAIRTLAPSQKVVACQVVDTFYPSFAGGGLAKYSIQGNSIDDPFTTGASSQPLGYDQWKALYKKAKVLGCKVIVNVHNGSSGAFMVGISPMPKNQGTTALSNFEHYMEAPGSRHKLLSPDVDKAVLVAKRSTKSMLKIANIRDEQRIEIDLENETAPTDNYYFHLWAQPVDQSTDLTGLQFVVTVRYLVLLYDYIIPSRSSET